MAVKLKGDKEFENILRASKALWEIIGFLEIEQKPSTAWSTDLIAVDSHNHSGVWTEICGSRITTLGHISEPK